jgi:hypothetical protein
MFHYVAHGLVRSEYGVSANIMIGRYVYRSRDWVRIRTMSSLSPTSPAPLLLSLKIITYAVSKPNNEKDSLIVDAEVKAILSENDIEEHVVMYTDT